MSDTEPTDTGEESSESGSKFDPDSEISDEDREQLEKERQERLDPENRPVNAEVDNTGREFDPVKEEFTYAPGEEPGGDDKAQAVIGADRPEGVESDFDDEGNPKDAD